MFWLASLSLYCATMPAPVPLEAVDARQVEVRWHEQRIVLQAGTQVLRSFGRREAEAREALRILRLLQPTQHGVLGTPTPILEYWLVDGAAPRPLARSGLSLLPIDRATLRVEEIQGMWCVRDGRRLFFNFGIRKQEAEQAVALIHQHGFTQLGLIGQPTPLFMYFLGDANGSSPQPASLQPTPLAPPSLPREEPPAKPLAPDKAFYMQQVLRSVRQLAPPVLGQSWRLRFEPQQLELRQERQQWTIVHDNSTLLTFGANQPLAQQALATLQHYGCTEQCWLGEPAASFSYFLTQGHAPRGHKSGLPLRAFRSDRVQAKAREGRWLVGDDEQTLFDCGALKEEAEQLVQVIQRHSFNAVAHVQSGGQAWYFMLRTN